MVGKIKVALQEIKGITFAFDRGFAHSAFRSSVENFSPERIIIESSGSAFPATLAFQIRELERETGGAFKLDAIVTVIDAENFTGYEDTSTTARMQAAYTDMLLIVSFPYLHRHICGQ
jgi:G3E family GTPase